jgi:hypothetical protein
VALIRRIHATASAAVIAVTGGAGLAIGDLLSVAGASRTVLEIRVPYAASSLAELLGGEPSQAVSAGTALAMARACHRRATQLAPPPEAGTTSPLLGIGCTAALASDRPKKGEHRAHVALCDGHRSQVWSLTLDKGARSRLGEDRLVSDLVLAVLADGCGLEEGWPALRSGDHIETSGDHIETAQETPAT